MRVGHVTTGGGDVLTGVLGVPWGLRYDVEGGWDTVTDIVTARFTFLRLGGHNCTWRSWNRCDATIDIIDMRKSE